MEGMIPYWAILAFLGFALALVCMLQKKPLWTCAGMLLMLANAPRNGDLALIINIAVCLIGLVVIFQPVFRWWTKPPENRDFVEAPPN